MWASKWIGIACFKVHSVHLTARMWEGEWGGDSILRSCAGTMISWMGDHGKGVKAYQVLRCGYLLFLPFSFYAPWTPSPGVLGLGVAAGCWRLLCVHELFWGVLVDTIFFYGLQMEGWMEWRQVLAWAAFGVSIVSNEWIISTLQYNQRKRWIFKIRMTCQFQLTHFSGW